MPNFDGKGLQGQGSLTGRRRGRCADNENSNQQNESAENKEIIYGLGRGGRPCGGGGFGQGQKGQQGQGRRRGFGRNQTFNK
jgi:hypothetical protein